MGNSQRVELAIEKYFYIIFLRLFIPCFISPPAFHNDTQILLY